MASNDEREREAYLKWFEWKSEGAAADFKREMEPIYWVAWQARASQPVEQGEVVVGSVDGEHELQARIYKRENTDEWVLELSGTINDTNFTCRHTEPMGTPVEDVAGLPSLYERLSLPTAKDDGQAAQGDAWGDKPDEYTAEIQAAHPMATKDYATYTKAVGMVGNRHSKYALVDLVNWLLVKATLPQSQGDGLTEEEAVEVMASSMKNVASMYMNGCSYKVMAAAAYRALKARQKMEAL